MVFSSAIQMVNVTGEDVCKSTMFVRDQPKVKPNDPCFCGTGKKYKKCHGAGI